MLSEAYGDYILLHRFQYVSTGFDAIKEMILTENKKHSGQPKKFEVEALLDQNPSQTQKELAESL